MRVFDFDNTIYDGESPYDFYLFSLKYNPKVVRFVPPLAYYGMRYSKEKCTLEELEHAMAKYLKAYLSSFDDIDGMVNAFWDAHMHKIKHWYHPQPDDVIMTGSFDYTMNEIQRRSIAIRWSSSTSILELTRSRCSVRCLAQTLCPMSSIATT